MLTSLGKYQIYKNRSMHWYRCPVCGEVDIADIVTFSFQLSCGCRKVYRTKHGHFSKGLESPTYLSWKSMKSRCENPKVISYPRYGGMGVTYEPAWKDFEGFLNDMGERPDNTTLDRIDNSKGYFKDNCRWATKLQQTQNRGITIRLRISEDLEMTAKEIADIINLGPSYVGKLIKGGKAAEVMRRLRNALAAKEVDHEVYSSENSR